VIITEPDLDHGIKTQFLYAATIDAGQIYTDQTGRFLVVSSKGDKYIMIFHLSAAYQIQNISRIIKSFPSYGTGIGYERPDTKSYETGQ
jgi:hypothetical protein